MSVQTQQPISGDFARIFAHLLCVGQKLGGQKAGVADHLCQELTLITEGRAQLLLGRQMRPGQASPSFIEVAFCTQNYSHSYGILSIAPDPQQPKYPSIPFNIAQQLAQICGWLLYTFEVSAYMQYQFQRLEQPIQVGLTRREQEVLRLICLGCSQTAIAQELCITPATVDKHRQHIYEQLGVHNERDAILMAYRMGLFSPLHSEMLQSA